MNFDFLKTVEVAAPEKKPAKTKTTAPKLPEGGLVLRVFANGKVYPSKDLVEAAEIEYTNKDAEIKGNGLDIFKSADWSGFPADAPEQFLFVSGIDRSQPKVDLFASCGYNEDGTPKTSVTEQGGGSFGKTLLAMVEDVFDICIPSGDFADLAIREDIVLESPNGLYYIPKLKSRGDDKGTITVQRRENIKIRPFELLDGDRYPRKSEMEPVEEAAEIATETVAEQAPENVTTDVAAGEDTGSIAPVEEQVAPIEGSVETEVEEPLKESTREAIAEQAAPEAIVPPAMPQMPNFPQV